MTWLAYFISAMALYTVGVVVGYWLRGELRRQPTLPAMTITGGSRSRLLRPEAAREPRSRAAMTPLAPARASLPRPPRAGAGNFSHLR